MSKQGFEAFNKKLSEDRALRQDMARVLSMGGTKTTASADEVVAFAKSRGYDFDAEDIRQNVELSDEELDAVAGGASDYLLKLEGIKGESTDSKHEGTIEIESYSWGVR